METVYITKSKLESIAHELDPIKFSKDEMIRFYEKRYVSAFNYYELQKLSTIKHVIESLQDEARTVKLIVQLKSAKENKAKQENQLSNLVYNVASKWAFHKDETCESLHSDYVNFEIPVEIPKEKHDEFRKFFNENKSIYENEEHRDRFYARAEVRFKVKIQNVNKIEKNNSGSSKHVLTHKSTHEVLAEIDALVEEMVSFRNQDDTTKKLINDIGMNPKKALGIPTLYDKKNIIEKWRDYKEELKNRIIEHLYSLYAPEQRFSRELLTKLGFKPCGVCFKDAP